MPLPGIEPGLAILQTAALPTKLKGLGWGTGFGTRVSGPMSSALDQTTPKWSHRASNSVLLGCEPGVLTGLNYSPVDLPGFEPGTFCLPDRRATSLRHKPIERNEKGRSPLPVAANAATLCTATTRRMPENRTLLMLGPRPSG